MNYLQKLEHWGDMHHPKYIDLLRILFGIFLCFKGVEFARNTDELNLMTGQVPFGPFMTVIVGHYVVFAHIFGGTLIALGLLTRIACLVQIPIVIGAMIFVNWSLMEPFSQFFLSLLVLVLLLYFYVVGNGPWSLDHAIDTGDMP